jgi:hypothetical protein
MKIFTVIVACFVISLFAVHLIAQTESAPAKAEDTKAMTTKSMAKPTMSKTAKIKNAMMAAPASIAKDATIMDWPEKEGGEMTMLKQGTNDWTCMPNDPNTPANDPMCLDKMGMEWGKAWMSHQDPKLTAPGFGYMLLGGGSASNTDPFAMKPKEGETWLKEPPHIMYFPVSGEKLDETAFSSDIKSGKPWIMFGGSPYAHLMIPVK